MNEYINKNDVLARIGCKSHSLDASVNHNYREAVSDIYGLVSDIPAEEVAQVRHGHWKKDKNKRACSLCGFVYYQNGDDNFSFCPDCGAKMDGAPK